MPTLVMIDGAVVPQSEARVSVFDRGFLYGDSVFETLRTYAGRPFAFDEHMQRLRLSAERVFMPLTNELELLEREVLEAIAKAANPESYIRVMLTRGVGESLGLDPAIATHPLRLVIVAPLHAPDPSLYSVGTTTVTFRTQRVADATAAAGAKIGNYLTAVLAMREARKVGATEALIVDPEGHVVEGATSNVFIVKGGVLVTPPENAGILAGITRAHVLEVARDSGLSIELRSLTLDEVMTADEVFISSSIRELVPVIAIDGRHIATGKPGPMTLELLRRFRESATRC